MASPPTPSRAEASLLLFATLLGLLLSVTICVICKKKRRKKKILVDRVKLVDVSLVRQTQLRSLSKSDTKLHELKRVQARERHQRPASMDFLCLSDFGREYPLQGSGSNILQHRQLPQTPLCNPSNTALSGEHTYSNLRFTIQPKADPSVFYESVTVTEASPLPGTQERCNPAMAAVRQEQEVISEYAGVTKSKRAQKERELEGAASENSPSQSRTLRYREAGIGNATAEKVEEMYSTVCKKRPHNPAPPSPENIPDVETCPVLTPYTPDSMVVFPEYGLQKAKIGACSEALRDPAYEAIDVIWKKKGTSSAANYCPQENFYESISEVREGL
ncbi:lck-interacting transmembrane adapter 1 [Microcaecilia unicolor]|uniref:Lck-interacting transmembrane adapter 1 n=1 Tax=Microcaecilia unicolor TaxID=1415580 RepID=A0A6P7YSQ7_9AMPH|nr:lck-interacting transmembrane adapter 1 [Microcaecilia unicolor]